MRRDPPTAIFKPPGRRLRRGVFQNPFLFVPAKKKRFLHSKEKGGRGIPISPGPLETAKGCGLWNPGENGKVMRIDDLNPPRRAGVKWVIFINLRPSTGGRVPYCRAGVLPPFCGKHVVSRHGGVASQNWGSTDEMHRRCLLSVLPVFPSATPRIRGGFKGESRQALALAAPP